MGRKKGLFGDQTTKAISWNQREVKWWKASRFYMAIGQVEVFEQIQAV